MRSSLLYSVLSIILVTSCASVEAKSPFSFVTFKRSKEVARSSQLLTEDNGPWMIFVASFAGETAEREARELVKKLRDDFHLNAYLHKKRYDFTEAVQGKGFDRNGRPKRMRHAMSATFDEVAVLVGDYDSVDSAKLQKHLQQIKFASTEELSLKGKSDPTTRRFAALRDLQKKLIGDEEKKKKGPLGNAFATRNPIRPEESPTSTLDPLLVEMNKGRKFSLLDCPGKYSVRVASYRGKSVIDQKKVREIQEQNLELESSLDRAGAKAEQLTVLLRKRGIEAYVYHDRYESVVTVGSFQDLGQEQSNGQIELHPAVAEVIETFAPSKKKLSQNGVAAHGIQPKSLGKGKYVFDVAPQPVLVPRRPT